MIKAGADFAAESVKGFGRVKLAAADLVVAIGEAAAADTDTDIGVGS